MCAAYGDSISLGGVTLNVLSMSPYKVQSTVKQKIGISVVSIQVLGRSDQEYRMSVSGVVYADSYAALGTSRASLEALDDGEPHALIDGIHDGDYIIETGSLKFDDSGEYGNSHYRYTMNLVQKT